MIPQNYNRRTNVAMEPNTYIASMTHNQLWLNREIMLKTKEFLKAELDKLDRNAYWEIDGYGNTEYICKVMELYAEAAKNNMAGTVGFQACGDEGVPLSVKSEAHPIGSAVGG